MSEKINFVTTNSYKFEVAQQFFARLPENEFTVVQYDIETPEVQDDSEGRIAEQSALWVSRQLGELSVASDVGFRIDSLGGFPGPFVKYANNWLQPNDVLNMMRPHADRSARFVDVLAVATPEGESKVFVTETPGTIVDAESVPDIKWTMDAVFIPEGHTKTLAEMDDEEKDAVWSDEGWHELTKHLVDRKKNE